MSFDSSTAYAGMVCDLDETLGRTCILRSPLIADTFNWTCMLVEYHLSSDDVKLTLDLLRDGVSHITYLLPANESAIWIPNADLGLSATVQLTASRYLVSAEQYEYAIVSNVDFLPCAADTGRLHCLKTNPIGKFGNLKNYISVNICILLHMLACGSPSS